MAEGRAWSTQAGCEGRDPDGTFTVDRHEDASVTGRARTSLDGEPVDCWLVRRHVVETIRTARVTVTTESVRSELFAPSLGLTVYAVERMDVPGADGSTQSAMWTTELLTAAGS